MAWLVYFDLRYDIAERYVRVVSSLKFNGVVKTLLLVRCYKFPIITTYRMYAEIKGKLHASNMKLFTYLSKIDVFTSSSNFILKKLSENSHTLYGDAIAE